MTLLQREQKFAEPKGRKKWTNNSWLMSLLHEYTIRKIKTFFASFYSHETSVCEDINTIIL